MTEFKLDDIKPKPLVKVTYKAKKPIFINKKIVIDREATVLTVTETAEMIDFIVSLANVIVALITRGPIGIVTNIVGIGGLIPKLIKAVSGMKAIPVELEYLTQRQKNQIIKQIKDELTFDETTESIIEIAIEVLFGLNNLVRKLF